MQFDTTVQMTDVGPAASEGETVPVWKQAARNRLDEMLEAAGKLIKALPDLRQRHGPREWTRSVEIVRTDSKHPELARVVGDEVIVYGHNERAATIFKRGSPREPFDFFGELRTAQAKSRIE